MTTVLLVRHGETPWNCERRLQGWAPTTLTETGENQAETLGDSIEEKYDIDKIYASDLPRTKQTAEIISRHVPADIKFSFGWRERDFGIAQGLSYREFSMKFPDLSLQTAGEDAITLSPESGESLLETKQRVMTEWETLLNETTLSNTVLVVTHSGPISLLLAEIDGRTIVDSFLNYPQENCAINEITVTNTEKVIVKENHSFTPTRDNA